MSAYVLKIIACIAMLVDHTAYVFEPQLNSVSPWLYVGCRMFGRLAFPLFALGVAEGTTHTSSPKKYLRRMIIFTLIAQIPFSLMLGISATPVITSFTVLGQKIALYRSFSVMMTLLLGLCACLSIHNGKHFGAALAIAAAWVIDHTVGMDYGLLGVLFIIGLYLARQNKGKRLIVALIFIACFYFDPLKSFLKTLVTTGTFRLTRGVLYAAAMAASAFIMLFYNKKPGRKSGLLFYAFYPTHMLMLWLIWFIIKLF